MGFKQKKGQISNTFVGGVTGAVAFGVLVIAVSLMATVLATNQDTQGSLSVTSVTNESIQANQTVDNSGTPTITNNIDNTTETVYNASFGELTRHTDYELTTKGEFTLVDEAGGQDAQLFNITYNYQLFTETPAYNASGSGLTGLINASNLVPTLGLIFGVVLVLSLLLVLVGLFGMKGGGFK